MADVGTSDPDPFESSEDDYAHEFGDVYAAHHASTQAANSSSSSPSPPPSPSLNEVQSNRMAFPSTDDDAESMDGSDQVAEFDSLKNALTICLDVCGRTKDPSQLEAILSTLPPGAAETDPCVSIVICIAKQK